jgi:hypothetical protein
VETSFIQFSSASYSVKENAGSITVTVTRTGSTAGTASISYSSADVSASSGFDYEAASGTLTFAAGESSKTITVFLIDDAIAEGNETFNLILSDASNANLGTPTAAIVTVVDNEKIPRGRRIREPRSGRGKRVLER